MGVATMKSSIQGPKHLRVTDHIFTGNVCVCAVKNGILGMFFTEKLIDFKDFFSNLWNIGVCSR